MMGSLSRGIVVVSGGTAANSLVDVFNQITQKKQCPLSYVIPISDNGGSSSELIRVFGGPGIGDIRSRLVRLIPPTHDYVYALLNHRLPPSPAPALAEWQVIVDGTSDLWAPIPPPQRELIRSMLNHLNMEIVKRARPPSSIFNFTNASVGNLFLTGARIFTGSFESAIYLLASIGGVHPTVRVIPAINSNFSHHISAGLADGAVIVGQNAISHPSATTSLPDATLTTVQPYPEAEDAHLPYSLPTLREPSILFSKTSAESSLLPSAIERIWYINPYGQEIHPAMNPLALTAINGADTIVYSIGSLYTSILPCVILRGVGVALSRVRNKILLLNGNADRETSAAGQDAMDAAGFVNALALAGEESRLEAWGKIGPSDDISESWHRYVTHVVYLDGEGVPTMDKKALESRGVQCLRCWGRKHGEGADVGMRYDEVGLRLVLEGILGIGKGAAEKSRRNTFEGLGSTAGNTMSEDRICL